MDNLTQNVDQLAVRCERGRKETGSDEFTRFGVRSISNAIELSRGLGQGLRARFLNTAEQCVSDMCAFVCIWSTLGDASLHEGGAGEQVRYELCATVS